MENKNCGVIRPARELNININDKVQIGDITMFNVGGEMIPVEVIQIYDGCNLKLRSCDLERVWDFVSLTTWLKQVEFMKQLA